MRRIVYDGDSFYELDEECVRRKAQMKNQDLSGRNQQNGTERAGEKRKMQRIKKE